MPEEPSLKIIRWKPALRLLLLGAIAIVWVRWREEWPFQKRNLVSYEIAIVTGAALLAWWLFFSRVPMLRRLLTVAACVAAAGLFAMLFRIEGVSGDLVPTFGWRFSRRAELKPGASASTSAAIKHPDFAQFYGPDRNGVLPGPKLVSDWAAHPPQLIWKKPVGPGWSGFVVVGDLCLTQEQRGDDECVSAFALSDGGERWVHRYPAHYQSTIGGEGPRATPTVRDGRVYALGSTGILNCLELQTGKLIWTRDVTKAVNGKVPEWGVASSPLLVNDLVVVHGGNGGTHSLVALRASDGETGWKGGDKPGYATPVFATLAGVPQIVAFNDRSISGHDPKSGATLWQRPWGNGNVVCASPVVVGDDQVLFSSGYGVGAELLKLTQTGDGVKAESMWQSTRMKAKFAHLFVRDGCVFGLDDGMFACADLKDGSKRWREGRYGHGQGLVVGEHYLLMGEQGELVLLRPTRDAPNELARFRVLNAKTWNPMALAGPLLLVRNDREAMCLRLAIED